MFAYTLQRRYVLAENEGLPPFILAETVGIEYGWEELRKAYPNDPRAREMPYSPLDELADEIQCGGLTRIVGREDLEANPEWAEALRRWQAGDDLVFVEHTRLEAIRSHEYDLVHSPLDAEGALKYLAEAARAGGSLLPA